MIDRNEVLAGLAKAVLDARSHIGPRRPYDDDEPEDAKQWDDLTKAATELEALAAKAEPQGGEVAWQMQLANALESFWNPAVGAIQDASYHGPASGSDVVGAIAQGFAAIAGALREQQQATHPAPKPAEVPGVVSAHCLINGCKHMEPAEGEGWVRVPDHVRRLIGRVDQFRMCMSYNESYFGEPVGLLKGVFAELGTAVNPIYPDGTTALYPPLAAAPKKGEGDG